MPKVTAVVSKTTNRLSLVQGHEYDVIGIDDSSFRVIDECGEPALYPKDYFLECVLDPPDDWVVHEYEDGEYTCSPRDLSQPGFFEDYSDGCNDAINLFNEYVRRVPRVK